MISWKACVICCLNSADQAFQNIDNRDNHCARWQSQRLFGMDSVSRNRLRSWQDYPGLHRRSESGRATYLKLHELEHAVAITFWYKARSARPSCRSCLLEAWVIRVSTTSGSWVPGILRTQSLHPRSNRIVWSIERCTTRSDHLDATQCTLNLLTTKEELLLAGNRNE